MHLALEKKKKRQVYPQRQIKIKVSESVVATNTACHQKTQHFAMKDRL